MTGKLVFAPWVRRGIANAIPAGRSGGAAASVELTVDIAEGGGVSHAVKRSVSLAGPASVRNLAPQAVTRRFPAADAGDAQTNFVPFVEFAEPDLPWRFSPEGVDATSDRLRPWIALLVLRGTGAGADPGASPEGVSEFVWATDRAGSADKALPPSLTVRAGTWMPDPAQAWAWAHVQLVDGGSAEANRSALDGGAGTARLLAPRLLAPAATWTAVLVPLFEGGRESGLGLRPTESDADAWVGGKLRADLSLPVFASWSFATGPDGDFESLARRLRARPLPPWIGRRPVDGSSPFGDGADGFSSPVMLGGALQPAGTDAWFARQPGEEAERAAEEAAFSARLVAEGQPQNGRPTVGPPTYGLWPAQRSARATGWVGEVNGQAEHRIAAGAAVEVIQRVQRELMESAWDQVGDLLRANEELALAKAAREAAAALHAEHFERADDADVLFISRAMHERLPSAGDSRKTVEQVVEDSAAPDGLFDPAVRRLTRTGGRLGGPASDVPAAVRALADGSHPLAPPQRRPSGMTGAGDLPGGAPSLGTTVARTPVAPSTDEPARTSGPEFEVGPAPAHAPWVSPAETTMTVPDPTRPDQRGADVVFSVTRPDWDAAGSPRTRPAFPLADEARSLREALDPTTAINTMMTWRIQWSGTRPANRNRAADPLDPIIPAPTFPRATYKDLAALGQDWMLPGLEDLPADTISLAETNPAFIEAFLVSLNHEMARELMWNGYPSDPAATCLHHFWDVSGQAVTGADGSPKLPETPAEWAALRDIPDVHTWSGALGSHLRGEGAGGARVVLLLRGSLLQRFPRAQVCAIRAKLHPESEERTDHPALGDHLDFSQVKRKSFGGRLDPDLVFVGFDLTIDEAMGDAQASAWGSATQTDHGWYFALVEPPTDTRFGLDLGPREPLSDWSELRWSTVGADDTGASSPWLDTAALAAAAGTLPVPRDAAALAAVLYQPAARAVFHAADLFGGAS